MSRSRTRSAASSSEAAARSSPVIVRRASGVSSMPDGERREPEADALAARGEQGRHHLLGVEGQLDDGDEQVLLAAEVVRDQPGVDAGVAGDAAQRRARVALLAEGPRRGGEDRLARAAARRPAAPGAGHPGLLVDDIHSSGEESMPCHGGQARIASRMTSRPTEPRSSERRWKSLSEKASPSRCGHLVAQLQPEPLADLVARRLARPAEVAVQLEAQHLLALVGVGVEEGPGLVVGPVAATDLGGASKPQCTPMSSTTRAARSDWPSSRPR